MKKRVLSLLLVFVMCLLPMTALAEDAPWAQEAVDLLNTQYPNAGFTASTDPMTENEAASLVANMGRKTNVSLAGDGVLLRAKACEVLADLFGLETDGVSAIQFLHRAGIVSGYADGTLGEEDPVRRSDFAVLAHRILDCFGDKWTPEEGGPDDGNPDDGGDKVVTDVTADKDAYKEKETITVTVTGITEQMVTEGAFVAVYAKDSDQVYGGGDAVIGLTQTGDVTLTVEAPGEKGEYEVRLYADRSNVGAETLIASAPFVISGTHPWGNASPWATEELKKADELGLIPDNLLGADFTQDITRAEFAAVCVKTYEALSGVAAIPAVNNPFADCNDVEVLKAYNIGAVNGMNATTYAPDALLTREQMATMLTRVFKRITLVGWTLATDSQFTLSYTKPAPFADDADISGYAKDSVYFMAANGIIKGVGNNKFAPRNTTPEQEATGYALATREAALAVAVRMVENLGA